MFDYILEYQQSMYSLLRGEIALACPYKGRKCGNNCPLFNIEKSKYKSYKFKVILSCCNPNLEYHIKSINTNLDLKDPKLETKNPLTTKKNSKKSESNK